MKNISRFRVILVLVLGLVSFSTKAAPVSGQGTWETTLQARDFDGNTATIEGYYDTALNITWLADANYASTSGYSLAGLMDWSGANAWAAGLNINGISGWRLPTTGPVNGSSLNYSFGFNGSTDYGYGMSAPGTVYAGSTGSEMAHMFYNTLDNKTYCDPPLSTANACSGTQGSWGLTNTGPFSNILISAYGMPRWYWSATESAISTYTAWNFSFWDGRQDFSQHKSADGPNSYAWAVHSGNVGASIVPVPAAFWLFGSGLIGMLGFMRRRNTPQRNEN